MYWYLHLAGVSPFVAVPFFLIFPAHNVHLSMVKNVKTYFFVASTLTLCFLCV